jgi:hypothetical protein
MLGHVSAQNYELIELHAKTEVEAVELEKDIALRAETVTKFVKAVEYHAERRAGMMSRAEIEELLAALDDACKSAADVQGDSSDISQLLVSTN